MSGCEQNTTDTKKTNMRKNKNGFLKFSIPGNLRTYNSYRLVYHAIYAPNLKVL